MLSPEQQRAVRAAAHGHSNVVITGGPGSGKSHTIHTILQQIPRKTKVALVGSTGRSADFLNSQINGRACATTLHMFLGFPGGVNGYDAAANSDVALLALIKKWMKDWKRGSKVKKRVGINSAVDILIKT